MIEVESNFLISIDDSQCLDIVNNYHYFIKYILVCLNKRLKPPQTTTNINTYFHPHKLYSHLESKNTIQMKSKLMK